MISKINNNSINFTSKRKNDNHIKKTIDGAISGAIIGAVMQTGYYGFHIIKNKNTMTLAQFKDYSRPMLSTIKNNALTCAVLNGVLALGFSIYNSIKNRNS